MVSEDSDSDGSARFDDEEVSKFANSNRGSSFIRLLMWVLIVLAKLRVG